jgi:DNA-binding NarL/FixJ family response regulator
VGLQPARGNVNDRCAEFLFPLTDTPDQEERIRELFRLITGEKDPERVHVLAAELARLLMVKAPLRKPSDRELRIIELVAKGLNNNEIAEKLRIGPNVVRNYLSKIYNKVGVRNRVQLALWYEARVHEQRVGRRSN